MGQLHIRTEIEPLPDRVKKGRGAVSNRPSARFDLPDRFATDDGWGPGFEIEAGDEPSTPAPAASSSSATVERLPGEDYQCEVCTKPSGAELCRHCGAKYDADGNLVKAAEPKAAPLMRRGGKVAPAAVAAPAPAPSKAASPPPAAAGDDPLPWGD